MAKVSFCKPKYAKVTVSVSASGVETETIGDIKTPGKGINLTANINTANTTLYADDGIAEYDTEFVDGDLTLELDELTEEAEADFTGASIGTTDKDVLNKSTDAASYIRQGGIIGRVKNNVKQYRAVIYMRVKYGIPSDNYQTRGQSVTYGTTTISGKVMKNVRNEWRYKSKWVDTVEAAEELLDAKLAVTTSPLSSAGT